MRELTTGECVINLRIRAYTDDLVEANLMCKSAEYIETLESERNKLLTNKAQMLSALVAVLNHQLTGNWYRQVQSAIHASKG